MDIDYIDNASPAIQDLFYALDGPGRRAMHDSAGESALIAIRKYYIAFGERGGWENPALPTHGPGRVSSKFAASKHVDSWVKEPATDDSIGLVTRDPILSFKIRGGTIAAKRVKALTIPVVPEAHGIRARNYEAITGRKLFRPKGKSYLAEKVAGSTIRAVYVLKRSVTMEPWRGAMPPGELVAEAAIEGIEDHLDEILPE